MHTGSVNSPLAQIQPGSLLHGAENVKMTEKTEGLRMG